jgi:hypothetical protein
MDVCLVSVVYCQVEVSATRADLSYRGVLWISVCCECCVLSGRGLCDGLIAHPEESYRLWCVVMCELKLQE